jgi:hypothetical protein
LCIDQLDELDAIAIGKPNGAGGGETAGSGPVDVEALEAAIVSGESYHLPCARVAGYWRRLGVPLFDAHDRLVQLFDQVFPADRDNRWQARRDDVLRTVAGIYRKDEAEGADAPQPNDNPSGTASGPAWPEPLGLDARHGVAGDILAALAPRTEADEAALLFQFLTVCGCLLGNEAWYFVEGAKHAPRLFTVLVGRTSIARKGSALAQIRRLFDAEALRDHTTSGLSSGEGLIHCVRDRATHFETDRKTRERVEIEDDPGVADKRLLVVEEEFGRVLRVKARENSILPDVLRQAWDGADLGVMTRKARLRASAAHICIIGHVTADELSLEMDDLSTVNGLGNRFLFCCAKRSRLLPFGGGTEPAVLDALRRRLAIALAAAPKGEIAFDIAARALWQSVYAGIAGERHGLFGALTSRAAPQVVRVALIYALLDGSERIGQAHLKAGLAVWRYAEASVRHAFRERTGNPVGDHILASLRDAGPAGLGKTQLFGLFGRHVNAGKINTALRQLEEQGFARKTQRPPGPHGGKPAEMWVAI